MEDKQVSSPSALKSETRAHKPLFPFLDLKAEYATMKEQTLAAVHSVLESQQFIMGPEVEKLEAEVAGFIGCTFAIACASGSDALLLSLMSVGVGSGDEVITTPFTFVATAGSIARLKAKPVFVDIDPQTYNLDCKQLEAAFTRRTKAVIPVHLFGLPAEMSSVMEIARAQRVAVVEDAAQAIGSRYHDEHVGNIGTCGCFSFFPTKNLGGAGDGGMISTNDPEFADRLSVLRNHGSRERYHYELLGLNSRLDALQAAILRVKFSRLDDWTEARRQNAKRYRQLFKEAELDKRIGLPGEPQGLFHVYHQFVIRTSRRDELRKHLLDSGIPTEIYYPVPLHLQPAFAYLGYGAGSLPQTEAASREVLALPIFPTMTEVQQGAVVNVIAEFFAGKN